MTNRQFVFSFSVGLAFVALGAVIQAIDAVGFSLIALGAGIVALACVIRSVQGKAGELEPARVTISQLRDAAPDY